MIVVYVIAFFIGGVAVASVLRGAIYVPTDTKALATMLAFADPKPGETMVDLGAGDGRIVVAFAVLGIESHGYEHNPLLTWWARRTIRSRHLVNASMHTGNLWNIDLGTYDIIVIFGATHVMERFERKLAKEARPGARVITHLFPLLTWRPEKKEGGVYLYRISASPSVMVG